MATAVVLASFPNGHTDSSSLLARESAGEGATSPYVGAPLKRRLAEYERAGSEVAMTTGSEPTPPTGSKSRLRRLAGAVTGRVVETIDPDTIIDHVDVDHLLDRVEVDRLLDRVDIDHLLDRVDVNRLLDRVDVNRVLDRVDVEALLSRVDIDALLRNVDLEAAMRRAGVPELVAESTNRMAGSAIDLARRQLVGLDLVVDRVVNRLLGRDPDNQPLGPPDLVAERTT